MSEAVVWPGTRTEHTELLEAVAWHCSCVNDGAGRSARPCEPHQMVRDQRGVDRLVFVRRIANRLR